MSDSRAICQACKRKVPERSSSEKGIEQKCPNCGAFPLKREYKQTLAVAVKLKLTYKVRLLIDWIEVERLLSKNEYAAAVLVAAINVEFILREHIQQSKIDKNQILDKDPRSHYYNIGKCYLGTCFNVAKYLHQHHNFILNGDWKNQISPIIEPRNKISHERGYFKKLTRLEAMNKTSVIKLITNAQKFCDNNSVSR